MVGWPDTGLEPGRRLHWEAQRGGLGRARNILAVGDRATWIRKLVADRWADADQLLDFYYASQRLWSLGEALYPKVATARWIWVEARLHGLRHGKEQWVLKEIEGLPHRAVKLAKSFAWNKTTCRARPPHELPDAIAQRGWPIGSGVVDSGWRTR